MTKEPEDTMPANTNLPRHELPLIELGRHQCRYPVREDRAVTGGHRFCAAQTLPDRAYCEHHHSVVTAVDTRRAGSGFVRLQRRAA